MAEFLHEVIRKREGTPTVRFRRSMPSIDWRIRDLEYSRFTVWRRQDGSPSNLWLTEMAMTDANSMNEQAYDEFVNAGDWPCSATVDNQHRWTLTDCTYREVATHYFRCLDCNQDRQWRVLP